MQRTDSFEKILLLGKIKAGREGDDKDELVGWHHRLNGHGFGWTPGVGDGPGGLACCRPWGRRATELILTQNVTFDAYFLSCFADVKSLQFLKTVTT